MKKIKVLYFVDRMRRGGIQSLVLDWAARFDKNKIQIDFLLLDDGNRYELEDTLKELGCNVYKLEGVWIKNLLDFFKYGKKLDDFFKKHNDYKVVHLHSSSKNYQVLKYAKKYDIPMRISHSHNIDFQTTNPLKKFIGNLLKKSLVKYSTNYFACSKIAGEWLFGKKITTSKKFKVIHNAVDYKKFAYNEETRKKIRTELNINENSIVLGNVARFERQKNHEFLIDIFFEYQKNNKNAKLLLIGTGTLETLIREKVRKLRIEDKVIFAGFKNNVNEYMQAMDYFIFPSLFEGLGLVLIEAQVSGMPCFTSKDVVPYEVKVSDSLEFLPLSSSAKRWCDNINAKSRNRSDNLLSIKKNGYFVEDVIKELEKKYLSGE